MTTSRPGDAVRSEWLRRVEAEYRSAALAQHLTLWLIQLGASPDLVRDGLRIVDDELVHAEMSHEVYVAAGGQGAPAIDREDLELARDSGAALEDDVARVGVRVFCLGETVAVPLFRHLREQAEAPPARAALDRILVDEVRHRDFGWTLLDWLLEHADGDRLRALLTAELPAMLAELDASYGEAAVPDAETVGDDDRRWGLAPAREYAAVLARCKDRDYRPRFARAGIAFP